MLSIIIPIYNERKHITRCLDSVMAQDYPKDNLELLLIDGMSNDGTRDIILQYIDKYAFIRLIDNPKKIVPCAMNIGIRAAKGNIIMRMDAHSFYEKDYVDKILEWHERIPEAWNVGGMCDTRVVDPNPTSCAIAKVMSDKFGVGNSKFRTGSKEEWLEVDTVPFGCYKKEMFDVTGLYNEKILRGQDIELNKRVKAAGGKIIMVPSIRCTYIPRDNYRDFYINYFRTGFWVIKACFITGSLKHHGIRHYVPTVFVLSLLLPLLAMPFCLWSGLFTAFVFLLYGSVMLLRSIRLSDKSTTPFHLLRAFFCIHFSYGLGSLSALVNGSFERLLIPRKKTNI